MGPAQATGPPHNIARSFRAAARNLGGPDAAEL